MIQDKIQKINNLNEQIGRIRDFITLAVKAQEIDEKNSKSNELGGVNRFIGCKISANISTGSQSPRYDSVIIYDDVIKDLMAGGLDFVKSNLKVKEEELNKLVK